MEKEHSKVQEEEFEGEGKGEHVVLHRAHRSVYVYVKERPAQEKILKNKNGKRGVMNGHCMMAAALSDVVRERMKGRKKKRTRKRAKRKGKGKAQAVEAVEGFAVNEGICNSLSLRVRTRNGSEK